jgi:C1A family cysteine protease
MVLSTFSGNRYGWVPDRPDHRDVPFLLAEPVALPKSVDLSTSKFMPPVCNQGELGSCTANALAGNFDFERAKQGQPFMSPSRLAIYYEERALEHSIASDSGAQIRDGIKVLASEGAFPESLWPYDITEFKVKPPAVGIAEGLRNKLTQYARVAQTALAIQSALAGGHLITAGFTVYESFESPQVEKTGIVPMPSPGEAPVGGHAIDICGYMPVKGKPYLKVRNSWGNGWGQKGYFQIPLAYFTNRQLASDLWVITGVQV